MEWLDGDGFDYAVDPRTAARPFYAAIRRYWPGLADRALAPDYAGFRPKLTGPRQPAADFRIAGPGARRPRSCQPVRHRVPGLTACLAIADLVCERLAS